MEYGEHGMATDAKTTFDDEVGLGDYQYGFRDPTDHYVFTARKGLDREIVAQISALKSEPAWMREFIRLLRQKAPL